MKQTIDAKGKSIGRVATEAAHFLMDKHTASFARNKAGSTTVEIVNVGQLSIAQGKALQKHYTRYSGYPGGLKLRSIPNTIEKKGHGELIRLAVYGMLPSNKLRPLRMKRLTVHE